MQQLLKQSQFFFSQTHSHTRNIGHDVSASKPCMCIVGARDMAENPFLVHLRYFFSSFNALKFISST